MITTERSSLLVVLDEIKIEENKIVRAPRRNMQNELAS